MTEFTIDELLAALTAAQETTSDGNNGGAYTVRELAAMLPGRSQFYIRDLLRKGIEAGTIEATRVIISRIDGQRVPVAAYRLRKE